MLISVYLFLFTSNSVKLTSPFLPLLLIFSHLTTDYLALLVAHRLAVLVHLEPLDSIVGPAALLLRNAPHLGGRIGTRKLVAGGLRRGLLGVLPAGLGRMRGTFS